MIKFCSLLCLACIAAFSIGCASTNPYETEVVEGIDTAVVPADERPRPEELQNERLTLAVLPAFDSTGELPPGLTSDIESRASNLISERTNVRIASSGATVKKLIDEQKRSASSIYDPAGAVEVGKLLSAAFVASVTVTSHSCGSVYDYLELEDENGNPYIASEWWDSHVTIGMSISIINVATGEYVFQKNALNTYEDELDRRATQTFYRTGARNAAMSNLAKLTLGLSSVFPMSGYVLQSRGEREWILINLGENDGISRNMGFYVYRIRTTLDPITGKEQRQYIRVGELATDQPDQLGYWCRVIDGAEQIKIGMLVRSSGRYRSEGLFVDTMDGE